MSVTVFRFENDRGTGPFMGMIRDPKTGHLTDAFRVYTAHADDDSNPISMPTGSEEPKHTALHARVMGSGIGGYRFAFSSLDKVRQYFPSAAGRLAMAEGGCKLYAITVHSDAVFMGESQCVFNPEWVERKIELDPQTLEEQPPLIPLHEYVAILTGKAII